MTNDEAQRITQQLLDRQGEVTIAGDIEATLTYCDLPCTFESLQGRVVVRTAAEMRGICARFISEIRERQLTHMVRRCLAAVYKGEDAIWATYETRYIRDRQLLTEDPYLGFIILRRRAGRWKISAMQFAVGQGSPADSTLRDWSARRSETPPAPPRAPACPVNAHRDVFENLAG